MSPLIRCRQLLRVSLPPLAFLLAIGTIVPVRRDANVPTEYSLVISLHDAFLRGLHYGSDLAFTFGPWGFILGGTHPGTLALVSFLRAAIVTVGLVVLWRRLARHIGTGLAWAAIVILAVIVHICWADTFFYFLPFLVLFEGLERDDGQDLIAWILLVVVAALLSLTKFPFMVMTAVATVVVSVAELLRRRLPLTVFTYVVGVAFFWFIAGQRAADFIPYVRDSLELSMGNGDAMGIASRLYVPPTFAPFLIAAIVFTITAIAIELRVNFARGVLFACGWLGAFSILFKSAYVRADFFHIAPACGVLLVTQIAYLAMRFRSRGRPARVLLIGAIVAAMFTIPPFFDRGPVLDSIDTVADAAINVVRLLRWPAYRDDAERFYTAFLNSDPRPSTPLRGDVMPGPAPIAFQSGFTYVRRPVFESYCVYTPKLSQLDVRWFREHTPDTVLFDINPIDRQYPSLEDGAVWPILLACYSPSGHLGSHAILRRRAGSPPAALTRTAVLTARLGETVVLPPQRDALRFTRIHIELSPLGRVERTFYKTPPLQIRVGLADSSERHYRLVRGMAENDFLLSPLVENRNAFVDLAARRDIGHAVKWMEIGSESPRAYVAEYRIELLDWNRDAPIPGTR